MKVRTKKNMKMVIFLSEKNPLWGRLLGRQPDVQDIQRLTGVTHQNHDNWKAGVTPRKKQSDKVFDQTLASIHALAKPQDRQQHLNRLKEVEKQYEDDSVQAYITAIALSIHVEQAQMLIDSCIYSSYPLFPALYFEDRSVAEDVFGTIGGVYRLWAWHGDTVLKCALRARYVLDVGHGSVIRCKLNLPPDGNRRLRQHEYDGFVTWRHHKGHEHLFWLLEGRKQHNGHKVDYLLAVTSGLRSVRRTPAFVGRFMGPSYPDLRYQGMQGEFAAADYGRVFAMAGDVEHDTDLEAIRDFMAEVSVVSDPAEMRRLEALVAEFSTAPPIEIGKPRRR